MEREDSVEIDHLAFDASSDDHDLFEDARAEGTGHLATSKTDDGARSGSQVESGSGDTDGIDNWELGLALETVLSQGDTHAGGSCLERVLEICKGRRLPAHLRAQVWQLCLDVDEYTTKQPLVDIYDLPEQQALRADCQHFVETLVNTEDEDRLALTSDLESILTSYSKSTSINYSTNNGWLLILRPLLSLRLTNSQLYTCFRSIMRDYIPRDVGNPEGLPFHIFRLLLLYHDPTLCSLLDSKRVTPFLYTAEWFRTLFSTPTCNGEAVVALWDIYFQFRDPFLSFYMALALIINAKDQVIELQASADPKTEIIKLLENLPNALEPDDISDFVTIAQHYAIATPSSYRRMFETALFGSESFLAFGSGSAQSTSPSRRVAMHSLCMPISADELLHSIRVAKSIQLDASVGPDYLNTVRFFVVDCRPPEQYNAGHLPTAFHLDCGLMMTEPVSFSTAVQGLLLAQKEAQQVGSAAGGEHLCFVGSGHEEEDQYVNMVVSSFLQRSTEKVGLLSGGYQALHELLQPEEDNNSLADHDVTLCIECCRNATASKPPTSTQTALVKSGGATGGKSRMLLNSFSTTWKSKTADLKGKLFEYIVNPATASAINATSSIERHIKSGDKDKSRPYRNLGSVFSLGDEQQGSDDETSEAVGTRVHIKAWLKRSEVLGSFQCSEVMVNGDHYVGYVAVTPTKIYMLRETDERDVAEISICRLLSTVVKITSKKRHPELITFKYGTSGSETDADPNSPEGVLITHCDRFYLANGTREFVALVKKQIDERLNE